MGKYFGTDGFRGRFGSELTVEHALKIGNFLGFYYKTLGAQGILIGMDTRESGPFLKTAVTMGCVAYGLDVYDVDVIPTPGVAYLCRTYNMPGVMITASHNPYWDNGIKILNEDGEKAPEHLIKGLEAFLDLDTNDYPESDKKGNLIKFQPGKNEYAKHISNLICCDKNLKIAIDASNGAASLMVADVYKAAGIDVVVLNNTPDGKNINNGCGSTHPEYLCEYVKKNGFDIGFAYDGDADRCLMCDSEGNLLSGDHILYAYGIAKKDTEALKNNVVVTTVMSNFGLYQAFDKAGISYLKTDVGDKYVYEAMKKDGLSVGGEQSGHIIFRDYATTGDGMLTSVMMLNLLKGKTVSDLMDGFTVCPQVLKNVMTQKKKEIMADSEILSLVRDSEAKMNGTGRILVRASGTEPKIRVMAEGSNEELCKEVVQTIVKAIEAKSNN